MSNNTITSNNHQIPPNYGLSIGDVTNDSAVVRQEYKDGWVNSYNKDGYLIGAARPIDYTPPNGVTSPTGNTNHPGEINRPGGLTLLDTLDKLNSSLLKNQLIHIKKNPESISFLNNNAL